jgi:hypothetical protein
MEEAKLLQQKREKMYATIEDVVKNLMNSLDLDQDGRMSREEYINHFLK